MAFGELSEGSVKRLLEEMEMADDWKGKRRAWWKSSGFLENNPLDEEIEEEKENVVEED